MKTPRLPTPGQDDGTWGDILNQYLNVSHNADGSLREDAVTSAGSGGIGEIPDSSITTQKLAEGAVTDGKLAMPVRTELSSISSKYTKPASGIPSTDLSTTVQSSLAKAESALQNIPDSSITAQKLVDGTVTPVKLDASTQAKLSELDTKYTKPINGIPKEDLETGVQASLEDAQGAVAALHQVGGGNFIANPAFYDGVSGYSAGSNCTIVADNFMGLFGDCCARVTRNSGAGDGLLSINTSRTKIAPSLTFSASAWVRIGSLGIDTARQVMMCIDWYDATSTLISSTEGETISQPITGTWIRIMKTNVISPDTAAYASLRVVITDVPEGESHLCDGFQLEVGRTPTSFNANMAESSYDGSVLAPNTVTSRETAVGSARCLFGPGANIPDPGIVGRLFWATDTNGLYFDSGASWVSLSTGGDAPSQPQGIYADMPLTIDPRVGGTANSTVTANNVYYYRAQGSATISGLAINIGTADSASSVNLGVYANVGTGRGARPGTLKKSLTISLASNGYRSGSFDSSVAVNHGDWFALSTASTTATFLRGSGNSSTGIADGLCCYQSGGPILPSTVGTLYSWLQTVVIVGV